MILLIELSQFLFLQNKGMKGIKQLLTVPKGYSQPDPMTALELLAQQLLKYPNLESGYNLSSPSQLIFSCHLANSLRNMVSKMQSH
jgi:hypothetical protein